MALFCSVFCKEPEQAWGRMSPGQTGHLRADRPFCPADCKEVEIACRGAGAAFGPREMHYTVGIMVEAMGGCIGRAACMDNGAASRASSLRLCVILPYTVIQCKGILAYMKKVAL